MKREEILREKLTNENVKDTSIRYFKLLSEVYPNGDKLRELIKYNDNNISKFQMLLMSLRPDGQLPIKYMENQITSMSIAFGQMKNEPHNQIKFTSDNMFIKNDIQNLMQELFDKFAPAETNYQYPTSDDQVRQMENYIYNYFLNKFANILDKRNDPSLSDLLEIKSLQRRNVQLYLHDMLSKISVFSKATIKDIVCELSVLASNFGSILNVQPAKVDAFDDSLTDTLFKYVVVGVPGIPNWVNAHSSRYSYLNYKKTPDISQNDRNFFWLGILINYFNVKEIHHLLLQIPNDITKGSFNTVLFTSLINYLIVNKSSLDNFYRIHLFDIFMTVMLLTPLEEIDFTDMRSEKHKNISFIKSVNISKLLKGRQSIASLKGTDSLLDTKDIIINKPVLSKDFLYTTDMCRQLLEDHLDQVRKYDSMSEYTPTWYTIKIMTFNKIKIAISEQILDYRDFINDDIMLDPVCFAILRVATRKNPTITYTTETLTPLFDESFSFNILSGYQNILRYKKGVSVVMFNIDDLKQQFTQINNPLHEDIRIMYTPEEIIEIPKQPQDIKIEQEVRQSAVIEKEIVEEPRNIEEVFVKEEPRLQKNIFETPHPDRAIPQPSINKDNKGDSIQKIQPIYNTSKFKMSFKDWLSTTDLQHKYEETVVFFKTHVGTNERTNLQMDLFSFKLPKEQLLPLSDTWYYINKDKWKIIVPSIYLKYTIDTAQIGGRIETVLQDPNDPTSAILQIIKNNEQVKKFNSFVDSGLFLSDVAATIYIAANVDNAVKQGEAFKKMYDKMNSLRITNQVYEHASAYNANALELSRVVYQSIDRDNNVPKLLEEYKSRFPNYKVERAVLERVLKTFTILKGNDILLPAIAETTGVLVKTFHNALITQNKYIHLNYLSKKEVSKIFPACSVNIPNVELLEQIFKTSSIVSVSHLDIISELLYRRLDTHINGNPPASTAILRDLVVAAEVDRSIRDRSSFGTHSNIVMLKINNDMICNSINQAVSKEEGNKCIQYINDDQFWNRFVSKFLDLNKINQVPILSDDLEELLFTEPIINGNPQYFFNVNGSAKGFPGSKTKRRDMFLSEIEFGKIYEQQLLTNKGKDDTNFCFAKIKKETFKLSKLPRNFQVVYAYKYLRMGYFANLIKQCLIPINEAGHSLFGFPIQSASFHQLLVSLKDIPNNTSHIMNFSDNIFIFYKRNGRLGYYSLDVVKAESSTNLHTYETIYRILNMFKFSDNVRKILRYNLLNMYDMSTIFPLDEELVTRKTQMLPSGTVLTSLCNHINTALFITLLSHLQIEYVDQNGKITADFYECAQVFGLAFEVAYESIDLFEFKKDNLLIEGAELSTMDFLGYDIIKYDGYYYPVLNRDRLFNQIVFNNSNRQDPDPVFEYMRMKSLIPNIVWYKLSSFLYSFFFSQLFKVNQYIISNNAPTDLLSQRQQEYFEAMNPDSDTAPYIVAYVHEFNNILPGGLYQTLCLYHTTVNDSMALFFRLRNKVKKEMDVFQKWSLMGNEILFAGFPNVEQEDVKTIFNLVGTQAMKIYGYSTISLKTKEAFLAPLKLRNNTTKLEIRKNMLIRIGVRYMENLLLLSYVPEYRELFKKSDSSILNLYQSAFRFMYIYSKILRVAKSISTYLQLLLPNVVVLHEETSVYPFVTIITKGATDIIATIDKNRLTTNNMRIFELKHKIRDNWSETSKHVEHIHKVLAEFMSKDSTVNYVGLVNKEKGILPTALLSFSLYKQGKIGGVDIKTMTIDKYSSIMKNYTSIIQNYTLLLYDTDIARDYFGLALEPAMISTLLDRESRNLGEIYKKFGLPGNKEMSLGVLKSVEDVSRFLGWTIGKLVLRIDSNFEDECLPMLVGVEYRSLLQLYTLLMTGRLTLVKDKEILHIYALHLYSHYNPVYVAWGVYILKNIDHLTNDIKIKDVIPCLSNSGRFIPVDFIIRIKNLNDSNLITHIQLDPVQGVSGKEVLTQYENVEEKFRMSTTKLKTMPSSAVFNEDVYSRKKAEDVKGVQYTSTVNDKGQTILAEKKVERKVLNEHDAYVEKLLEANDDLGLMFTDLINLLIKKEKILQLYNLARNLTGTPRYNVYMLALMMASINGTPQNITQAIRLFENKFLKDNKNNTFSMTSNDKMVGMELIVPSKKQFVFATNTKGKIPISLENIEVEILKMEYCVYKLDQYYKIIFKNSKYKIIIYTDSESLEILENGMILSNNYDMITERYIGKDTKDRGTYIIVSNPLAPRSNNYIKKFFGVIDLYKSTQFIYRDKDDLCNSVFLTDTGITPMHYHNFLLYDTLGQMFA